MPRRDCTAWKLTLIVVFVATAGDLHSQDRIVQRPEWEPADKSSLSVVREEASSSAPVATSENVSILIEQLASPEFEMRERATLELLMLGEPALQSLKNIASDAPFEVLQRSRLIEQKISARIFAERSRKFLLDTDPSNSYELPGWNHFRPLVGSTRTSKLMFLDMLENDRPLVRLITSVIEAEQATGENGGLKCQELTGELTEALNQRAEVLNAKLYSLSSPSIGEMLTVLFAATATKATPSVEVNRVLLNASQLSFHGYLRQPGYKDCLKKLLAAWLPRTHEGMAPEAIRLAMGLELPVVTQLARRHLSQNFDVASRALAFQYMASYGESGDVPALLEYAQDETIVEEFSDSESGIAVAQVAPPGVPVVPQLNDDQSNEVNARSRIVRINDLAVACSMMILQEDPRSVFPRISQESAGKLMLHELAVTAEEAPKQAAAARAWVSGILERLPRG